jgi:hypothetical protein
VSPRGPTEEGDHVVRFGGKFCVGEGFTQNNREGRGVYSKNNR